jgi:hypothetical protein
VEITLTLEPSDRYRPAGLGMTGGTVVLYVERPGGTDLAILGEPTELRRLAHALDDAADLPAREQDLLISLAGTPEPQ